MDIDADLDQLDSNGISNQLGCRANAELAHNFVFVRFCRTSRDSKLSGNFFHRLSFRQELQYLALSESERCLAAVLPRAGCEQIRNQISREQRRYVCRASGDTSNGFDQ